MTNIDSILKSRDSLPTNVSLVKTVAFSVVMYLRVGLQRKLSAEELMLGVWRTLESPLDCMEIRPVYPKGNPS